MYRSRCRYEVPNFARVMKHWIPVKTACVVNFDVYFPCSNITHFDSLQSRSENWTFKIRINLKTRHFEGWNVKWLTVRKPNKTVQFSNGQPFHGSIFKCHLKTGQNDHSKTGPFHIRSTFDHSKTGHLRFSDPHCIWITIETINDYNITFKPALFTLNPQCRMAKNVVGATSLVY